MPHSTRSLAAALAAALGLVLAAGASPARAAHPEVIVPEVRGGSAPTDAQKKAAIEAYGEAAKYYGKGKLNRALEAARKAYQAVPNANTALILATILGESDQPCEAFRFLLAALQGGPTPEERSQIVSVLTTQARACGGGLGWAEVTVEPDTALATVSGRRLITPVIVGLSAGEHAVTVVANGFEEEQDSVRVEAGVGMKLRYRLRKVAPPPRPDPKPDPVVVVKPPPPAPVVAKKTDGGPGVGPWILIGTGSAAVVGGVVAILLGVGEADEANRYASGPLGMPTLERQQLYEDAKSSANTLSTVGWVTVGLGVAAGVAGAVLLSLGGDDEGTEGPVGALSVGPLSLPDGGGVVLGGAF